MGSIVLPQGKSIIGPAEFADKSQYENISNEVYYFLF